MTEVHEQYMQEAIRLAQNAAAQGEVPVGALIVREDGLRLGMGFNQNVGNSDPTAHAEVMALREAGDFLGNYRLSNATLYVTLEPCLMCFTAMIHARVARLVYGAGDPKTGFTRFLDEDRLAMFNHKMEIVPHILEEENAECIRAFFREKRERGKRRWLKNQS